MEERNKLFTRYTREGTIVDKSLNLKIVTTVINMTVNGGRGFCDLGIFLKVKIKLLTMRTREWTVVDESLSLRIFTTAINMEVDE